MTLTIDIKPEVYAELVRRAASNGKPVEDYAASLLEEAVDRAAVQSAPKANTLDEPFAPVRLAREP